MSGASDFYLLLCNFFQPKEAIINQLESERPYADFLHILRRSTDAMQEGTIREELFSVERLEQYAVFLADEFKIGQKRKSGYPLLTKLKNNGKKLLESYLNLVNVLNHKLYVSPAAEWFVDNFYIIDEQIKSIQRDLPKNYYLELPKLSKGELKGYPRVYALSLALMAHTDSRIDTDALKRYLISFQKVEPLSIGELWATSIALRMALIDHLQPLAALIVSARDLRAKADLLADKLLAHASSQHATPNQLIKILKKNIGTPDKFERAFIVQLIQRLRDQELDVWPAFDWIEKQLISIHTNTIQVVQFEHHRQAATQVTVGNIISSMRLLSTMDWKDFFESISLIDPILAQDPSGEYSKMNFSTRDQYRHAIERLCRRSHFSEIAVANKALELAQIDNNHIGHFLIGDKKNQLEDKIKYRPQTFEKLRRYIHKNATSFYLLSVVLTMAPLILLINHYSYFWVTLFFIIPISEFSISLLNDLIAIVFQPKLLPKMNLSNGISVNQSTMVVIPTLFTSEEVVVDLLEHLEVQYVANQTPNLYFALLGDFSDSNVETLELDSKLLNTAQHGIAKLNHRYAEGRTPSFYLFHRYRQWNPAENKWIGWERKRGKLEEFNHLLRGNKSTSYLPHLADPSLLANVKYVITLDSDTQLPRNSAVHLIETIEHPLNRPQYCEQKKRVISGHGVLQPRVSVSLVSASRTNFSKIFCGNVGLDPYTTAVSDTYQDLFGEGSYTGKGLYDVDIFEKSLAGRVPENSILSHDLFEGSYARAALVTDIELFDDYPADYDTFLKRLHRWTRGDWQIAPWIFPMVPNSSKQWVPNDLPLMARWKIFDNLRRSLVAPTTIICLGLSWLMLPGNSLIWTFGILILTLLPLYAPLLRLSWKHFAQDLILRIEQQFFCLSLLLEQSVEQIDAIARTIYRLFISKKKLLEWVTFAQVSSQAKLQSNWMNKLGKSPWIACLLGLLILVTNPSSLASAVPILLLWISTPFIKSWLNNRAKKRPIILNSQQIELYKKYARLNWNFFENFVNAEGHWLAPDNFQEDPVPVVAQRTSPTNIGLQLLASISALDLGFINIKTFVELNEFVFLSIKKLPKFRGHLYNWYDTKTLEPLRPQYISTVDSGNFAGHLITFKQSCLNYKIKSIDFDTRLQKLINTCDQLISTMDFHFLFDKQRKIFSIGLHVEDNKLDVSFYDLLASESRLTSFIAIAKGDVPQEHWFRLGRAMTSVGKERALISWTASMFEYLMPLLVMRRYGHTLLDETYETITSRQKKYGEQQNVPWGISESGYHARDINMNYQYGPFGIPGLGLKRGLSDDLVIAPYATMLAAMIDPIDALKNLQRLEALNMLGSYGFYEAIDYTADRLPAKKDNVIINSFMAHHQGMSLSAINNLLNQNILQKRFHADPMVQSTELLLQERVPKEIIISIPRAEEIHFEKRIHFSNILNQRFYHDVNLLTPRTQILSNGYYMAMITSAGSGYSMCGPLSMGRWREDLTLDQWGHFFYIRNHTQETFWSAGFRPTVAVPEEYEVIFSEDKAEFCRRDGDILTHTEILVSPEDNVELRRVSLTNQSKEICHLDVTSFMEITLTRPQDDAAHPTFSNLFVETEFIAQENALLATRRKRSSSENQVWAFHVVVSESELSSPIQYETDRSKFIGRGHSAMDPISIIQTTPLSNTVGAVLDPIFSLRSCVFINPGETVKFVFTTGMVATRDDALRLVDKYHDVHIFARESDLAWTKIQVQLRHLNISLNKTHTYQRLASRVIFSDSSLRPPSHQLALNQRTQSALWAYGISGDLPIILMRINDEKDMSMVRELIHAHEYLRLKGLMIDLVILNERPASYLQALQEELQRQLRMSGSHFLLDKPGGVFIRRSDIIPNEDVTLLKTIARVVLSASQGTLDEQLARMLVEKTKLPNFHNLHQIKKYPKSPKLNQLPKSFDNGIGGFIDSGKEYMITLTEKQWTPAPWINVIANDQEFGFIVSETGSGYTWSNNSRENRLTTWSNDPISDPSSEATYIRDEESGLYWSPTALPIRGNDDYQIFHGQGYSRFLHNCQNISHEVVMFVPVGELSASIKIVTLRIKNLHPHRTRQLSVTHFVEWVLGFQRSKSAPTIITEFDSIEKIIFAKNPYNNEFADRVAFLKMYTNAERQKNPTFSCDRKEFLGRNGSTGRPESMLREELSGRYGAGLDPCGAQQIKFSLPPGEECEFIILLGQGDHRADALALAQQYSSPVMVKIAYQEVLRFWNETLSQVAIKTPDESMNLLMNRWLLYQTIACRLWGRSATYQSGGAFGFRDQLQDVMALVYSKPQYARQQILRAAARQFKEGDVQHWWHPPTGRGVRTRISDDLLWLPYVVSFYIKTTNDQSILWESIPFLEGEELKLGTDDSYFTPQQSNESDSILEHCARAIDRSLKTGAHGFPLIGSGDWNDGMNKVGHEGKGESIWLGWFLLATIKDFLNLIEKNELPIFKARTQKYQQHQSQLMSAMQQNAWDGEWYLRAFFDNGDAMGSSKNQECRIDAIAQSWSVLSESGESSRSTVAMSAVNRELIDRRNKIIKLFSPAFDQSKNDPGYIKGYVPGVRENGGQYTHAAVWTMMAFAKLGDGDLSTELFHLLNPINHSLNPSDVATYKVEPYVMAADIYGVSPHLGRGGWTWYTGSSSLMYRAGLESILGFQLQGDLLRIRPCIPSTWNEFEIFYKWKTSEYRIIVTKDKNKGSKINNDEIQLIDDGQKHEIIIYTDAGLAFKKENKW
jgi:cyclic beta-1,2-glucan synthetase